MLQHPITLALGMVLLLVPMIDFVVERLLKNYIIFMIESQTKWHSHLLRGYYVHALTVTFKILITS